MSLTEKIKEDSWSIADVIAEWSFKNPQETEETMREFWKDKKVIHLHDVLALLQEHEQKLTEFAELLKNRPNNVHFQEWLSQEQVAEIYDKWLELLEKKFEELTK